MDKPIVKITPEDIMIFIRIAKSYKLLVERVDKFLKKDKTLTDNSMASHMLLYKKIEHIVLEYGVTEPVIVKKKYKKRRPYVRKED
jgi:hypothetical protein